MIHFFAIYILRFAVLHFEIMAKQTKNDYFCGLNYIFFGILTLTLAFLPWSVNAFNLSFASDLAITSDCNSFCCKSSHTCSLSGENNQISANSDSDWMNPITKDINYTIKTVVIDPGHGGHDKGCKGAHSQEKHIALAIAKKLGAAIRGQYPNIKVLFTRTTDKFIPLHERARIANRNQADLFISVHCNYVGVSSVHGSETYVMGLHRADDNLAVAKRENSAIYLEDNYKKNYDYDPDSPEGHILLSMFQNAYLEQSISFAEKVEQQFTGYSGRKSRGVKQAGFLVLRETTMPSVLIEAGFLSNSQEEIYLRSASGQQYMANAIFRAFGQYKREVEEGSNTAPSVYNSSPAVVKTPIVEKVQVAQRQLVNTTPAYNTPINSQPNITIPPPITTTRTYTSTYSNQQSEILTVKGDDFITQTIDRTLGNYSSNPSLSTNSKSQNSKPQFVVQLAASPAPLNLNTARWQNVGGMVEEIQEAQYFKYQVRNFNTFEEAENVRQYMQTRGFADCFVVAYQNGQRIDVQTARALTP